MDELNESTQKMLQAAKSDDWLEFHILIKNNNVDLSAKDQNGKTVRDIVLENRNNTLLLIPKNIEPINFLEIIAYLKGYRRAVAEVEQLTQEDINSDQLGLDMDTAYPEKTNFQKLLRNNPDLFDKIKSREVDRNDVLKGNYWLSSITNHNSLGILEFLAFHRGFQQTVSNILKKEGKTFNPFKPYLSRIPSTQTKHSLFKK